MTNAKMTVQFKTCFLGYYIHSKQCWVVSTQIWVKYGQSQMLG